MQPLVFTHFVIKGLFSIQQLDHQMFNELMKENITFSHNFLVFISGGERVHIRAFC